MTTTTRSALAAIALLCSSTTFSLAQAPGTGHMTGAGASPAVSANGQLSLALPISLPPARGGVPAPLSIGYTGSTRLGQLGVGWQLSVPYVRRTVDNVGTRPQFLSAPNSPAIATDRVVVSLGGSVHVMVAESPGVYRPMFGPATLTLVEQESGWLIHDGQGYRYTFTYDARVGEPGYWLLTEVNDVLGSNPVRYHWDVQLISLGDGSTGREVNLAAIELNEHPVAGCAKHRVEFTWAPPFGPVTPLSVAARNVSTKLRRS